MGVIFINIPPRNNLSISYSFLMFLKLRTWQCFAAFYGIRKTCSRMHGHREFRSSTTAGHMSFASYFVAARTPPRESLRGGAIRFSAIPDSHSRRTTDRRTVTHVPTGMPAFCWHRVYSSYSAFSAYRPFLKRATPNQVSLITFHPQLLELIRDGI